MSVMSAGESAIHENRLSIHALRREQHVVALHHRSYRLRPSSAFVPAFLLELVLSATVACGDEASSEAGTLDEGLQGEDGEGLETCADRSYPQSPVSVEDLDDAVRDRAERLCRDSGVEEVGALDNCVLAVGLTDDISHVAHALPSTVPGPQLRIARGRYEVRYVQGGSHEDRGPVVCRGRPEPLRPESLAAKLRPATVG